MVTTGPWLAGSLSGFALSKFAPVLGAVRPEGSESVPRQAVFCVAKKSRNCVWSLAHGEPGAGCGPGMFT
jgi:hypothetical protein